MSSLLFLWLCKIVNTQSLNQGKMSVGTSPLVLKESKWR